MHPTYEEALKSGDKAGWAYGDGFSIQAAKAELWSERYGLNAVNLYEWLCRHYGEDAMALVDVDSSRLTVALVNDMPYEEGRCNVATTKKISRRSRNLGYGWTNNVVQDGDALRIEKPEEDVRGGPRTVLEERDRARRINKGNDWRGAYFVGGKRIVGIAEPSYMTVLDLASFLSGSYIWPDVKEVTVMVEA